MEGKHDTPSVIARLMGLDEQPLQQTPQKQVKVLSEEYLYKTSCIGVLGKRSYCVDRLNRSTAKKKEKHFDNSEVLSTNRGNIWSICDGNSEAARIKLGVSRTRSMHTKSASEDKILRPSKKFVGVLKDQHERDHQSYCHPYLSAENVAKLNALELHMKSKYLSGRRGNVCKNLKKSTTDRTISRPLKFESRRGELTTDHQNKFLKEPVTGQRLDEKFEMHDVGARTQKSYQKVENHTLSRPQYTNSNLGGPLVIGRKDGLKNECVGSLLRPNLFVSSVGILSLQTRSDDPDDGCPLVLKQAETETNDKLKCALFIPDDCLEQGSPSVSFYQQYDQSAHSQCSDNSQSNGFNDLPGCIAETQQRSTIPELLIRNLASINQKAYEEFGASHEDESSGIASSNFIAKDGSFNVHRDLASKISSCESNRGEWMFRCQCDLDFAVNSWDANQPTPDSVLEPPFKEDDSPMADLRSLAMKLELLDSKSEDTNSECSGMAVSIDEDTGTESCNLSQNCGRIWDIISPDESRDFSYLVDVLDEADINDGTLDWWYQRLHAREFAMSFSVFGVLEKKYGKQTSWQKSERKLFFDFINSGLTQILHSSSDFNMVTKPLRRRFSTYLRRAEIEDELWKSLIGQGKEGSKDLGEKALVMDMKWLDLEEDVSFFCTEIEQFLFDELAVELGSYECL